MSANNKLVISKDAKDMYRIENVDVDTGDGFSIAEPCKTLKEAITKANAYMQEEIVEYGLEISEDFV